MKLKLVTFAIAIFYSLMFAGSANALTFVTDDEAALKQQLTETQIANARLSGKAEVHEAKIALTEKEKKELSDRVARAEAKATRAQRAANKANYRLAVMKSKAPSKAKAKKAKAKVKANS